MQRFVNRRSLPHACKILLQKRVRDNANAQYTVTYTSVDDAVSVACRVTPFDASNVETVTADQLAVFSRVYVAFDAGTDIPSTARLFIVGITNGEPWQLLAEIVGKRSPRSSSSLARYVCAPVNEARK